MSTDMATLTGAYVVNALTGPERDAFERHLATCADCAQEAQELKETAARLGTDAATTPPEGLKQRVLDEIARTRQDTPQAIQPPGKHVVSLRRSSWTTRIAVAAAALGIALAGAFGGLAWHAQQQLAESNQLVRESGERGAEIARLLQAPDARLIHGSMDGARAVTVVSHQVGKAGFLTADMPAPPPDRNYQVWFVGPGGATSAGMLQPDTGRTNAPMVSAMPTGAQQMAITVEPAGGSPQPTTTPIMTMSMPA